MSSNIEVKLDVLNQKASPALYAAPLADRPAASFTGRLFVDSDSPSTGLYRDTGSTWVQVADAGAGTTGTLQQVTTNGNSTNVGITVSANGIGIGTTIPNTNRLDIHAASGIQATFNGTGTANSSLQLQSAGVGKWNVTNKYNAAANDFTITDVLNTVDRLTIKNTGLATYIGFLNVANIASAQNIQISGTAPAYTIVQGTTNENTASIGVASIANNFIQGSVAGDFCLVSQSTAAKRLLLGVQSANTSAICISASNNTLLGSTTDNGQKLQVTGNIATTGNYQGVNSILSGYSQIGSTHTVKLDITQSLSYDGIRVISNNSTTQNTLAMYHDATRGCIETTYLGSGSYTALALNQQGGNVLIGTATDNGFKLSVNGTSAFNDKMQIDTGTTASNYALLTLLQPNFASSGGPFISLGISNSVNNAGAIQFVYTSSGSNANFIRLSMYGGVGIQIKGSGVINLENVPTSAAGLVTGDVYRTANVLNIVP